MSQNEDTKQTIWARRAAQQIVDGALTASEHLPKPDQAALFREIAQRALWHMPNSSDESRELVRYFYIEIFVSRIPATMKLQSRPGHRNAGSRGQGISDRRRNLGR